MSEPRKRRSRVARKNPLPFLYGGIAIVGVLVVGMIIFVVLNRDTAADVPIEVLTDEGSDHVAVGAAVEYQSDPPASGNHWPSTAAWGFFRDTPPPDENLVHNLEHGGVIIWYDPQQVTEEQSQQLFDIYRELIQIERRVILTVREGMESPIALTAWNHRLRLDSVDEAAIRSFFDQRILLGPECSNRRCP